MFYDIQGAPYRNLCKKTCPDEGRTCLCYSRADKNKLLTYSPVLLNFNVTRNSLDSMLQCSWRTSLLPYVVPGCVQELEVDSVSSIAANASSLLSYQLKRLIDFMPDGHRLSLHVELRKNSGVTEVHQFEVLPSFDNPLDVYLFETLSPFTLYTVSVMTMAGTDKGCVKSLSFQTLKSRPLAPPELTGFDLSGSKLWLVWKVLSPEVAGSDKVTYELVITSANGVNYTYNQRSNLFNETLENIQRPLTISVWALNDVGKSEKSTVVNIPLNQNYQEKMKGLRQKCEEGSFKINGTFQRLKQISCFYNRQHNELFNANVKACVLNGCLHVHQVQNCSKPEQFFIQSFNVYPSLDGTTCNSTLRAFPHCLKDTEWSLPGDVKSVCIQARDSSEIDHGPPQLINIAQLASSDSHSSTNTIIYGFVGVFVLLAVVIILRVVYTCVKRRNQILKLVGSTNESLDIAQTTPNLSIATKDVSQGQSVQSKNCEDQTSTHGIFLDWLSGSSYARFSRLDKSLGRSNSMGACTNDSSLQSVSNTSDSSITQLL
uniref:Fibronectin type-III domain-containing protein n=1 Tax=Biomphalaria glabrata TaxID=6526 RepID=A0A2C9KKX4_BIOGL